MGKYNFNEVNSVKISDVSADNAAYKLGYDDAVKKACKWIADRHHNAEWWSVKQFKQAMEE